jgi:hypothetical protein
MKKIKAVKHCNWDVLLKETRGGKRFYWVADSPYSGIEELESVKHFKTRQLALKDWVTFARVNEIKDWFCMTEKAIALG